MVGWVSGGRVTTLGLLAGLASQVVLAQSLGLPASDSVGIGRSGTGVAFGTSLEAASLNPALLVTLRESRSAYLSAGMEIQSMDTRLETNGQAFTSSDRNRPLPALGAAWRLGDSLAMGLKYDQPYMLHKEISLASSVRFLGSAVELGTRRMELQGAWTANPHWSLGLGMGVTQVDYAYEVCVVTPSSVELPLRQEGKANALSYTLGFRWALNPRWTIGGTYQGPIKASPAWTVRPTGDASNVVRAGSGKVTLPARASLGVRQRVNQFFTWEVDLRYVQGANFELPSQPSLSTPSGVVTAPALRGEYRSGFGFSAMAECSWNKKWSARVGVEILPALVSDADANPLIGGSKSAGFSAGCGYKALGGEFSLGYQLRQSIAVDSTQVDGVWDVSGYHTTGNALRSKSKGQLLSIGYKRTF